MTLPKWDDLHAVPFLIATQQPSPAQNRSSCPFSPQKLYCPKAFFATYDRRLLLLTHHLNAFLKPSDDFRAKIGDQTHLTVLGLQN